MNQLQFNFYNSLNKLFDNKLPPNVQSIKIEASVDTPVCITAVYFPNTISNEPVEAKFGLTECPVHPIESNINE